MESQSAEQQHSKM